MSVDKRRPHAAASLQMTYAFFGFATVALAIAGMATFPKVQKRAQDLAGRLEVSAHASRHLTRPSGMQFLVC